MFGKNTDAALEHHGVMRGIEDLLLHVHWRLVSAFADPS
jgi:hypothetical protein